MSAFLAETLIADRHLATPMRPDLPLEHRPAARLDLADRRRARRPAGQRIASATTAHLDRAGRVGDKRAMHFLKTLFWAALAVIAVIFSLRNWVPVPINLWAGLTADVKLPVVLLLGAVVGFLPTYAVHRTKLWRLHRRIDNLERNALGAASSAPLSAPAAPDIAIPPSTGTVE
ncbi:LapA family protein [Sphingomonas sp. Root720]|uniref:LapA family protein n=2 Tax=Sphingomonas TaxID=13687 RepID=UPI001F1A131D|nr:LapA family protein [Sphingomonas sp. Root720]